MTPDGGLCTHRSYQTIQCLSEQLGLPIAAEFVQGQEQQLASSLVRSCSGVVLICWEHSHIPVIAPSLPVASATAIPPKWPDDRSDVIWSFALVPGPGSGLLYLRSGPAAAATRRCQDSDPGGRR